MPPKDRISGLNPLEPIPSFVLQGLPLVVVVDVPSGGFLQVVVGDNPMAAATPGPQLPKGSMLALIVPEFAEQIRPHLNKAQSAALKKMAMDEALRVVPDLSKPR